MRYSEPGADVSGIIDQINRTAAAIGRIEIEIGIIVKFQRNPDYLITLLDQESRGNRTIDPP
jgi:hypothetical protein